MAATLFVHPMDVVKNRMQMSGEGGTVREHKTSFHALSKIFRNEGFRGIYAGYIIIISKEKSITKFIKI
jgi:solute carrier family 25 oxoglutarate transporter 11